MLFSDVLTTAFIAGIVSVIVSVISYIGTIRQINLERTKLERTLESKYTEYLYSTRLKNYPRAIEITEELGKAKNLSNCELNACYTQIRSELRNWKSGVVQLILSNDALKAYYKLEEALKKNPERGYNYSQEQIKKIYRLRNKFRGALRHDLGLLFEEEIETQIAN